MQKVAEHNLGAGWILEQYCNDKGIEKFKFHNFIEQKAITLNNESVKTLREIFKKIG